MVSQVVAYANQFPDLYPKRGLTYVYYDGVQVRSWPSGQVLVGNTPQEARFFVINFWDGSSLPGYFNTIDTIAVANVSLFKKADELAQVIGAITTITHVKDVIVVAHSLGGLDTRAYIEGLADPYNEPVTAYTQDIAKLITLDTPHSGAATANIQGFIADVLSNPFDRVDDPLHWVFSGEQLVVSLFNNCVAQGGVNVHDLETGSPAIQALNSPFLPQAPPITAPINGVPISAIQDFTAPGLFAVAAPFAFEEEDDGVVTAPEQSIHSVAPKVATYLDIPNDLSNTQGFVFGVDLTCGFIHQIPCLAQTPAPSLVANELSGQLTGTPPSITVNATLNGNQWSGHLDYVIEGYTSPASLPQPTELFSPSGPNVPYTFYDGPSGNIPPGEYYFNTYLIAGPSPKYTVTPIVVPRFQTRQ